MIVKKWIFSAPEPLVEDSSNTDENGFLTEIKQEPQDYSEDTAENKGLQESKPKPKPRGRKPKGGKKRGGQKGGKGKQKEQSVTTLKENNETEKKEPEMEIETKDFEEDNVVNNKGSNRNRSVSKERKSGASVRNNDSEVKDKEELDTTGETEESVNAAEDSKALDETENRESVDCEQQGEVTEEGGERNEKESETGMVDDTDGLENLHKEFNEVETSENDNGGNIKKLFAGKDDKSDKSLNKDRTDSVNTVKDKKTSGRGERGHGSGSDTDAYEELDLSIPMSSVGYVDKGLKQVLSGVQDNEEGEVEEEGSKDNAMETDDVNSEVGVSVGVEKGSGKEPDFEKGKGDNELSVDEENRSGNKSQPERRVSQESVESDTTSELMKDADAYIKTISDLLEKLKQAKTEPNQVSSNNTAGSDPSDQNTKESNESIKAKILSNILSSSKTMLKDNSYQMILKEVQKELGKMSSSSPEPTRSETENASGKHKLTKDSDTVKKSSDGTAKSSDVDIIDLDASDGVDRSLRVQRTPSKDAPTPAGQRSSRTPSGGTPGRSRAQGQTPRKGVTPNKSGNFIDNLISRGIPIIIPDDDEEEEEMTEKSPERAQRGRPPKTRMWQSPANLGPAPVRMVGQGFVSPSHQPQASPSHGLYSQPRQLFTPPKNVGPPTLVPMTSPQRFVSQEPRKLTGYSGADGTQSYSYQQTAPGVDGIPPYGYKPASTVVPPAAETSLATQPKAKVSGMLSNFSSMQRKQGMRFSGDYIRDIEEMTQSMAGFPSKPLTKVTSADSSNSSEPPVLVPQTEIVEPGRSQVQTVRSSLLQQIVLSKSQPVQTVRPQKQNTKSNATIVIDEEPTVPKASDRSMPHSVTSSSTSVLSTANFQSQLPPHFSAQNIQQAVYQTQLRGPQPPSNPPTTLTQAMQFQQQLQQSIIVSAQKHQHQQQQEQVSIQSSQPMQAVAGPVGQSLASYAGAGAGPVGQSLASYPGAGGSQFVLAGGSSSGLPMLLNVLQAVPVSIAISQPSESLPVISDVTSMAAEYGVSLKPTGTKTSESGMPNLGMISSISGSTLHGSVTIDSKSPIKRSHSSTFSDASSDSYGEPRRKKQLTGDDGPPNLLQQISNYPPPTTDPNLSPSKQPPRLEIDIDQTSYMQHSAVSVKQELDFERKTTAKFTPQKLKEESSSFNPPISPSTKRLHAVPGTRSRVSLPETSSKAETSLSEKAFGCGDCGKTFATKHGLTLHFRKHTKDVPFECDVCGRHYSKKACLMKHIMVHFNEQNTK